MHAHIDHVVMWVDDPMRALDFYERVVGFTGVRVDEFAAGTAPFVSVRLADDTVIDLMARSGAASADAMAGAEGSAGHPLHHLCLAMARDDFDALHRRLAEHGVPTTGMRTGLFGARGPAPRAFYFHDADGNVIEARHYDNDDG